ncbi:MAG: GNAT family N-acetyltransferase [Gemmataceae bacterium]|nr:GNAT family N-acetyltransferase [Gemmataceae bacterium]
MIKGKNIKFRLAEASDAEFILSLRLDEQLNRHISKVSNDLQHQIEWLASYKERERQLSEYYFIIENNAGQAIGTVRLYDFQGDSFSWGSWIMKQGLPPHFAIESAMLVYEFAFGKLGFVRSHFDVRRENLSVIRFHKRFGAEQTREDALNYYFQICRSDYEARRDRYKEFLER